MVLPAGSLLSLFLLPSLMFQFVFFSLPSSSSAFMGMSALTLPPSVRPSTHPFSIAHLDPSSGSIAGTLSSSFPVTHLFLTHYPPVPSFLPCCSPAAPQTATQRRDLNVHLHLSTKQPPRVVQGRPGSFVALTSASRESFIF